MSSSIGTASLRSAPLVQCCSSKQPFNCSESGLGNQTPVLSSRCSGKRTQIQMRNTSVLHRGTGDLIVKLGTLLANFSVSTYDDLDNSELKPKLDASIAKELSSVLKQESKIEQDITAYIGCCGGLSRNQKCIDGVLTCLVLGHFTGFATVLMACRTVSGEWQYDDAATSTFN